MLDKEQKNFLREQKIPFSKVFDATGLSREECKKAMDGTEMSFYSGGTPCFKNNHTLRTKSGHCIQCDTKKIAFQLRSQSKAHVYIAGSVKGRLIKVGTSIDLEDRVFKINTYQYGGYKDWRLLASAFLDKSGRIENHIHQQLKDFQVNGSYWREGREQQCYELFRCDFIRPYKTLSSLGGKSFRLRCSSLEQANANYSFE